MKWTPPGAIDLCSLQFMRPHSPAQPCSAALISPPFNSCIPYSLLLSVCCGKRQLKTDVSDLGLVLRGSRGWPCLTAIRSFPPIPISRRAAGSGWEQIVAVQRGLSRSRRRICGPEEVWGGEVERRWDGGTTACGVECVCMMGGFCRTRVMERDSSTVGQEGQRLTTDLSGEGDEKALRPGRSLQSGLCCWMFYCSSEPSLHTGTIHK